MKRKKKKFTQKELCSNLNPNNNNENEKESKIIILTQDQQKYIKL